MHGLRLIRSAPETAARTGRESRARVQSWRTAPASLVLVKRPFSAVPAVIGSSLSACTLLHVIEPPPSQGMQESHAEKAMQEAPAKPCRQAGVLRYQELIDPCCPDVRSWPRLRPPPRARFRAAHAGHDPVYSHLTDPKIKTAPARDHEAAACVRFAGAESRTIRAAGLCSAPLPLPRSEMAWATALTTGCMSSAAMASSASTGPITMSTTRRPTNG